jgi:hypothetical protein
MTARGVTLLGIEVFSERTGVVERAYLRPGSWTFDVAAASLNRQDRTVRYPESAKIGQHSGNHRTLLHRRETIKTARGWT